MSQTASSQIRGSESNLDLGILVGLLLTDGSVSKHNNNSWKIEFSGKSEELHQLFKKSALATFGRKKFTEMTDKRFVNIKRTFFTSKTIGNKLINLVPSFRTKQLPDGVFPNSKLPDFIFESQQDQVTKILQAMFSTDGSVCLWITWHKRCKMWGIKKLVKLSCKHPVIREQVSILLKRLGF